MSIGTIERREVEGLPPTESPPKGVGEGGRGGWFPRNVILVVAILWLFPALGVLISSVREPDLVKTTGWWTVFAHPFQLGPWTFANYR
jgi:alpha-glucoside transport system permease protein